MAPRRTRSDELIDLLAADLPVDNEYTPPARGDPAEVTADAGDDWLPPLGPKGTQAFHSDAKFMLLHGERFSGKTYAGLHRVIKGLYLNDGASACLSTLTKSQAILGGMWTKFQQCLEIWRHGAWINGIFYEGLGIEGFGKNGEIEWKQDEARNRFAWIKNEQGGGSMAFLRSMIHGEHIAARIKSMEFTTFFFDELTDTDDEDYFVKPIQQLYRIPGVKPQQYIAACNPPIQGEDHWVHGRFFRGFNDPKDKKPKKREEYCVIHVPITDNTFVDEEQKKATIDNVNEECRIDPTAYDRLILGKWTKRPTGNGLFAKFFRRGTHVRGDVAKKQFIIPSGMIIDVGYDMGSANTSISFAERHYTTKGELWALFDELVMVGEYVATPQIAEKLLGAMNYWCGRTNKPLHFNHISDEAAFNQRRMDGSYDARKLEACVTEILTKYPERYPHLGHLKKKIRLKECPKPKGSVASRAKMLIGFLQAELAVLSARCFKHIEMMENLEEHKEKPFHPVEVSRHRHPMDSFTYVMYYYEMGGKTTGPVTESETKLVELHP